jgi:pyruvate dehydrogenase E1 component alpha subunit
MNKSDLINFEKEVIENWKKGETYAPIHLSGGNEEQLINIFKGIKNGDWVFSTHRSHHHALLKSKDKDWLMNQIIKEGNSSHINSAKYKIFTSAIVGGNIPIALGVALALKKKRSRKKVYCFVGDMASQMGQFNEAVKYADGHNLPIIFVIENNKIGCETPLYKVWSICSLPHSNKILYYEYKRVYPHCGCGVILKFKKKKFKSSGDYNAYK